MAVETSPPRWFDVVVAISLGRRFQSGGHMGTYLRGTVGAGLIALGGAGVAVIGMNLHSGSPRLMTAGIISAIIGILGGGIGLARR